MNRKELIKRLRAIYDEATESADKNEDVLLDGNAKAAFKVGYMRSAISLIASDLERLEGEAE